MVNVLIRTYFSYPVTFAELLTVNLCLSLLELKYFFSIPRLEGLTLGFGEEYFTEDP